MKDFLKIWLLFLFTVTGSLSHGAAVIFSGSDVKTLKSNIDLNGNAKILSGSVDPTSSATSAPIGSIYLNTSTGLSYRKLDAGSSTNWVVLGSGSSSQKNYVTNPGAEAGTTGWTTYADAAGTSLVDGTGGSPTITWTRSTSSPMAGIGSFLFTKDASNRQGEGVCTPLTLDSQDQGKPLQIDARISLVSGTWSGSTTPGTNSDVTVQLYDVTNTTVIEPSGKLLEPMVTTAPGGYKYRGTFQTSAASTSYRLCFHATTTSASAYVLKFDDISVGPQVVSNGAVETDFTSYTPTISGFGTTTGVEFFWKRQGSDIIILGKWIAGTVAASQAQVGLPSGLALSSSIPTSFGVVGMVQRGSTGVYEAVAVPAQTHLRVTSGTNNGYLNGNQVDASSSTFTIYARAPIQGWASNVQMSNDTDTRVVTANYNGQPTGTLTTSFNKATVPTKITDTHGAYSSGVYTVQVAGYYNINASLRINATYSVTHNSIAAIYVNGAEVQRGYASCMNASVSFLAPQVTVLGKYLSAGDTVEVRAYTDGSSPSYANSTTDNWFSIARQSGPSQIAATETVSAKYVSTVANNVVTDTIIDFATKSWDSHGAVTTGASWKFTAPTAGEYQTCVSYFTAAGTASSIGNFVGATLRVNGAGSGDFIAGDYVRTTSSITKNFRGCTSTKLLAGDYIDLRGFNDTGQTHAAQTSAGLNYILIRRVGNY